MACAIEEPPTSDKLRESWGLYLNTVGTYGFGSASWWWGRLAALITRLGHYVVIDIAWIFRYADDFLCLLEISKGRTFIPLWKVLFFWEVLTVPLKWKKTLGGRQISWIGFHFDFEAETMGLSEHRASWVLNWIARVVRDKSVLGRDASRALGRMGFAAEVLRHAKPFLAPLYSWVFSMTAGGLSQVPTAIVMVLEWIAYEVSRMPKVPMLIKYIHKGELFRADAKAEGDKVVVGGWRLHPGGTRFSTWYSTELNAENAPWAFWRGAPFRSIAALELYATLLCLMLLVPEMVGGPETCVVTLGGSTDNLGNEFVIKRMMTTRMPLCLVLLELASQMNERNTSLLLTWRRRDRNQEADDLTNNKFEAFDPALRANVCLTDLPWRILPTFTEKAKDLWLASRDRPKKSEAAKGKKVRSSRTDDPW